MDPRRWPGRGGWAVAWALAVAPMPWLPAPSASAGPVLATSPVAVYSATYGFHGPAGLYGYGMGYDETDNTIVVADVWNSRVIRFSAVGKRLGTVSHIAPKDHVGGIGAPFGVAADGAGNVWVGDQSDSRVVEFDHSGNWLQSIGAGGGPNAWEGYAAGCGGGHMTIPTDVAIDTTATGNVYVSDPRCRNVYEFDPAGHFVVEFAWPIPSPIPRGVGIDTQTGHVLVAEFNTQRIYVFDRSGNSLGSFSQSAPAGDFADPRGLAVDNVHHLVYVVGAENNKVVVFDTSGSYRGSWGQTAFRPFNTIRFVTVDPAGSVYVSDLYGYVVWKLDMAGNVLPWATPPAPPPSGGYNQQNGVAIDQASGHLYVADTFENRFQEFATTGGVSCPSASNCAAWVGQFGHRGPLTPNSPNLDYPHVTSVASHMVWTDAQDGILKWDLSGSFLGKWGSHGAGLGQFKDGPQGLDVIASQTDPNNGLVYTSDTGNCRIQIFDYAGNLQSAMGSCGRGPNQMSAPRQLNVDTVHNLVYVADTGNSRIAVWDLASQRMVATITTVAAKALNRPRGVHLDPTGTWVYIGDTGNQRVLRVHPDGTGGSVVTTGSDVPPQHSLRGPKFLDFSTLDGRLFVSDETHAVYAFTVSG